MGAMDEQNTTQTRENIVNSSNKKYHEHLMQSVSSKRGMSAKDSDALEEDSNDRLYNTNDAVVDKPRKKWGAARPQRQPDSIQKPPRRVLLDMITTPMSAV